VDHSLNQEIVSDSGQTGSARVPASPAALDGSGTTPDSLSSPTGSKASRADAWRAIAVCGLLLAAVFLVFGQTLRQGFSILDDSVFVSGEPHVSRGFSWSGIGWAFTNGPLGEWYPLSMLSHMLDCQLYGLRPAGHHLSNVLLHAGAAVTLFLVLWRMTGGLWPSALVAAVFALHPLHVESVAWVAERRDVLSGLLFMLTLGAYGEYVRHPRSLARYLAVVGLFALGLMAKPMLVTLPALLLLLDFWPLARVGPAHIGAAPGRWQTPVARSARPAPFPWRVVVEKLPLFALAVAMAVLTMSTHHKVPDPLTLPERFANAAVSCVAYLGQFLVPVGLSAFYPHPEAGRPAWQVAAAVALLLAISVAAVIGRRSYPYFFVGWFWNVGMLLPVLGLTYMGAQSRADRYTYLPQIGLSIAVVWGVMRLGATWPARRWLFGIGSALVLAALLASSWRQTSFWQDDKTLWEHALACDPKNASAHLYLGAALEHAKDQSGAVAQYWLALERDSSQRNIHYGTRAHAQSYLGDIADRKGDTGAAIAHYRQAVESYPEAVAAHMKLANLLAKNGDFDEAMAEFQRSIELTPDDARIYSNRAMVLAGHGQTDEAIENCRKALAIDPNLGFAHSNFAALLAERGDVDEAITHLRRVIEIDPDGAAAYYQIAQLLRRQEKTGEAGRYEQRGRKVSRRHAEAQNLRGKELIEQGKISEAIGQFQRAIAVSPDYAEAHANLADALAKQGNLDDAIARYRQALEIDPNFARAKQSLDRLLNR
jgi:tetratricopeptide (TPR) repeat protein